MTTPPIQPQAGSEVKPAIPGDWFCDIENVLTLIRWLASADFFEARSSCGAAVRDALAILEKPWKWANEYRRMSYGLNFNEEFCPRCSDVTEAYQIQDHNACRACKSGDVQ